MTIAPGNGTRSAAEVFERLDHYVDAAKTRGERATYTFDVVGVGTWTLTVNDGTISAARRNGASDCVLRMNEDTFVRVMLGEQNPCTVVTIGVRHKELIASGSQSRWLCTRSNSSLRSRQ